VPGLLVLGSVVARLGGVGMLLQRDYSSMLTCAAMAFAAAEIPLAILLRAAVPAPYAIGGVAAYFAVLMFFAVRTVFGIGNGASAGIVAISWISAGGSGAAVGRDQRHPAPCWRRRFFLLFLWYYLGSEVAAWAMPCAGSRTTGACWRPRRSTRMMAKRSISSG